MERNQKILLLVLTLPLLLFSGGYAYAASTQATYVVKATGVDTNGVTVKCTSPSDYTLHYIFADKTGVFFPLHTATPVNSAGGTAQSGDTPNGWTFSVDGSSGWTFWAFCQSPITAAGMTVPEFGSFYAAIALAAVLYFGLTLLRQRTNQSFSVPK